MTAALGSPFDVSGAADDGGGELVGVFGLGEVGRDGSEIG